MDWCEENQRYLTVSLEALRHLFEARLSKEEITPPVESFDQVNKETNLENLAASMSAPPAMDTLCELFVLTPFERQILLMCAAVELDSKFSSLYAEVQENPRQTYPTFSLALGVLPEAHWSALSPDRPLRRWRLIEIRNGESLTQSLLRIDERVLNYLTGVQHLDERLVGYVEPVEAITDLTPSQDAVGERAAAVWSSMEVGDRLPVVQLIGADEASQRAVANAACARLGLNLQMMSAYAAPLETRELTALMRLWEREAIFSNAVLFLDCNGLDAGDLPRVRAVAQLMENTYSALIVAGYERIAAGQRPVINLDVYLPTVSEQKIVWENTLGSAAERLNGQLDTLVSQFSLSATAIQSAAKEALTHINGHKYLSGESANDLFSNLWDSARKQTMPKMSSLAQRIEPAAGWDDLVLPDPHKQLLREMGIHVRQRMKVYDTWGFAAKNSRGLGISALFHGTSGTGKTMAAEVLANELKLDLYRIDLSQVVNKYIGETEKNLRRVFDAAEGSGAILLFDEADALFGKRSQVKDSHDRYANIEIGYLLQRMEAYRGLAILTTNMKNSLDSAFLRRIRFIVQFPFPDASHRVEIWKRIFPDDTPVDGVDVQKLARVNVAGGSIKNMALYAAFLAAEAEEPVEMKHLHRAAQVEYAKLEKPLNNAEIGGWV